MKRQDHSHHSGRRLWLSVLALNLALVGLFFWHGETGWVRAIENQSFDFRMQRRGERPPSDAVVLLEIDDRSIAELGGWPIARSQLAKAVNLLADDGANVIAFDLLLPERNDAGGVGSFGVGDSELAAAAARAGNVVLPFAFAYTADQALMLEAPPELVDDAFRIVHAPAEASGGGLPHPAGLIVPSARLLAAAHGAHVNVLPEADGHLHLLHPVITFNGQHYPSLPVEVARLYWDLSRAEVAVQMGEAIVLGEHRVMTDPVTRVAINHYGPRGTFEHHAFADLLAGRIAPGTFTDKVVVVGSTALGVGDGFASPFDGKLSGAELLAAAISNILNGETIRRCVLVCTADVLVMVTVGGLAAGLAAVLPPLLAIIAGVALLATCGYFNSYLLTEHGLWLGALFPTAAIAANFGLILIVRLSREVQLRREAERQSRSLTRYVAPEVANNIAAGRQAEAVERTQFATVMFVDLVGFTRASENLAPADALELLRGFHSRVEAVVDAHGGTIDKFIGDGAMVLFGVAEPSREDPVHALACARTLATEFSGSTVSGASADPRLQVSIGVHHGPVVIGELGGAHRAQLTALGDTVNVASRLETMTRGHGVRIVASDAVMEAARAAAGDSAVDGFERLPMQPIKGRDRMIGVWAWSESDDRADGAGRPDPSTAPARAAGSD